MLKDHQDILWLAGQVLLTRSFVEEVEAEGLEAIFAACPYDDLTEDEKATFKAAFYTDALRDVIATWWKAYDEAREAGQIPSVKTFWG